ncbi:MAG: hypothetical protein WC415_02155 [Patescibacteria group bacterium]|jgi:hypothetical protein
MPSVDEKLLSLKTLSGPEQISVARNLWRKQVSARQPIIEEKAGEENISTFNQVRAQALKNKESAAEKIVGEIPSSINPAAIATASLLKKSWFSAATVVGFILGFYYINAHWLGNAIFGKKFFCDLGEEWGLAKSGKAPGAEILKDKAKMIGLGEKVLIGLIDVIILFVLLAIIFFLVMMSNAGQTVMEAGWEAITSWVKSTFGA